MSILYAKNDHFCQIRSSYTWHTYLQFIQYTFICVYSLNKKHFLIKTYFSCNYVINSQLNRRLNSIQLRYLIMIRRILEWISINNFYQSIVVYYPDFRWMKKIIYTVDSIQLDFTGQRNYEIFSNFRRNFMKLGKKHQLRAMWHRHLEIWN